MSFVPADNFICSLCECSINVDDGKFISINLMQHVDEPGNLDYLSSIEFHKSCFSEFGSDIEEGLEQSWEKHLESRREKKEWRFR